MFLNINARRSVIHNGKIFFVIRVPLVLEVSNVGSFCEGLLNKAAVAISLSVNYVNSIEQLPSGTIHTVESQEAIGLLIRSSTGDWVHALWVIVNDQVSLLISFNLEGVLPP